MKRSIVLVLLFMAGILICAPVTASAKSKYRLSEHRAKKAITEKVIIAEVMWDAIHNPAVGTHSKSNCSLAMTRTKRRCWVLVKTEGEVVCSLTFTVEARKRHHYHIIVVKTRSNTCYDRSEEELRDER